MYGYCSLQDQLLFQSNETTQSLFVGGEHMQDQMEL